MPIRFHLDNGLTVVFQEEHAARVVAFQLWVKTGGADEGPDQAGLAHFHEHMLFKGTRRRGVGEIAREVEAHGGEINAWTSHDQTVYHVVIASPFARVGLDVLSDAVRNSTFDPDELTREVEVVCEEIKRSEDSPSRRLWKELATTAFRVHPYRLPVLGTEASVRTFTQKKVRAFYERHYTPGNTVLVVAGDLSEENVRRWAQELLGGDWGRKDAPRSPRPVEPAMLERRAVLRPDDVKEVHLHLAFPAPAVTHPDVPALDTWATILGQGAAARLGLEVKRRRSLVNEIGASAYTLQDTGLFLVSLTSPAETLAQALEETGRILGESVDTPLPMSELTRAQRLIEAEAVYGREVVQGLARKLGFYETTLEGFESEPAYYAAVAGLTPERMQDVSRRTLDLSRVALVGLLPPGATLTSVQAFEALEKGWRRAASPAPAATGSRRGSKGSEGGVVIETLPSGARILIREERTVPLVALRGAFLSGSRFESEANAGISHLLARVITRGTPDRTAEEISRQVDAMAGSLGGATGRNSISLRSEFLSRHLEEGFELFADVLQHPSFPASEFAREQKQTLQTLATKEDRPSSLVSELFARALYPDHPYRFPLVGEVASVQALTPESLRTHHAQHVHPSRLHLAVVGDVDAGQVLKLAERAFGARSAAPAPLPTLAPPAPLLAPARIERALDKAQTHLMLGFRGARVDDRWRYALEVLSNVLSGMGGRLFVKLRDQQSLAYSVTSYSMEGIDPGYFAVYIGTSPDKQEAALAGIRAELERVRESGITPDELERARQNLVGAHEIGLQRASARAVLLALDDCYGLGLEAFLHYAEQIARIRAEDVQAVARQVIRWDQEALAVVGPKSG